MVKHSAGQMYFCTVSIFSSVKYTLKDTNYKANYATEYDTPNES